MSLIYMLLVLLIVGVVLVLINSYANLPPQVTMLLNIVVIVAVVIWLVNLLIGSPLRL